jgi:hypothetical protein
MKLSDDAFRLPCKEKGSARRRRLVTKSEKQQNMEDPVSTA